MGTTRMDAPRQTPSHEEWECREHLSKQEAERLLDWLEAKGYTQREVAFVEDDGFTVRWRSRE